MNNLAKLAKRLRQDLEEFKLQSKLGQKEAADFFEEKKEKFDEFIVETKEQLEKSLSPATEKLDAIHQDLDQLRLHLALGRMEGRDSFVEQKEKIEQSIETVRTRLGEIDEAADDALAQSKSNFAHRAGAFAVKLEMLALNLQLHLSDDEENQRRNRKAHKELEAWAEQIDTQKKLGEKEAHEIWKSLRQKIRNLAKGSK